MAGKDDHNTVGPGINVYPNYLTLVAKSEILDFIEELQGEGASQAGSQESN